MGQVATKTLPLHTFILVTNGLIKRATLPFFFFTKMVIFYVSKEIVYAIFGHFPEKQKANLLGVHLKQYKISQFLN